jgi:hypothetical protein
MAMGKHETGRRKLVWGGQMATRVALSLLWLAGPAVVADAAGTSVEIPWALVAGVTVLTVLLCSGAALVSIARLRRVEPTLVFLPA